MRHYEIIFIVHPDQSEQISFMIERYSAIINNSKGKINRIEDWGRRQLAYPINKLQKAHYILMNVESSQKSINEMEAAFKFNDAIIRSMIIRTKQAETEPSFMIKVKEERHDRSEDFIVTDKREESEDI